MIPVANTLLYPFQLGRAKFWRLAKRVGFLNESENTIEDQGKDRVLPFDEYPRCEMCGGESHVQKLVTLDGSRIVECDNCGLWFTSPRIAESAWIDFLKNVSQRSIEITENRIKFGCALTSNIKFSHPGWRKQRAKEHALIFDAIERHLKKKPERTHDVGCGVGLLMQDAEKRGMAVTGNELNNYAWSVMTKRLGLEVYNDMLPAIDLKANSLDAVVMRDYIEHTYHPLKDLKSAYSYLKPGGVIYVETFHIDCALFDKLKGNWNMLFWNHAYHFSQSTLEAMIKAAGFDLLDVDTSYDDILIRIVAGKRV